MLWREMQIERIDWGVGLDPRGGESHIAIRPRCRGERILAERGGMALIEGRATPLPGAGCGEAREA